MTRFVVIVMLLAVSPNANAQQPTIAFAHGQPFIDKTGVEQIQRPRDFREDVVMRSLRRPIFADGQPFIDKTGVEQIQRPREWREDVLKRSLRRPILVVFWDESPNLVPNLKVLEQVMAEFKNDLEHVYLRLPISSMKSDGNLKTDGSKADLLSKAYRLGVFDGAGIPGYPWIVAYYNEGIVGDAVLGIRHDEAGLRADVRVFCNQVIQKSQRK